MDVEFPFEEGGAALGVAEVFRGIAACLDVKGDSAALEGSADAEDALAMGVVEAFSDTNDGGKAARDALVAVVEG